MMKKITFLISFFLCIVANAQVKKTEVVEETTKKPRVVKEVAKKPEVVAKKPEVVAKVEEPKKPEGPKKVEVGKIISGVGKPPLMICKKAETTYFFTYEDAKVKHIRKEKTFKIEDVNNAFEDLYATIIKGFQSMPKEPIMLELPSSSYLWISYGTLAHEEDPIVKIGLSNAIPTEEEEAGLIEFSHEFTKKQIKKLFGKSI